MPRQIPASLEAHQAQTGKAVGHDSPKESCGSRGIYNKESLALQHHLLRSQILGRVSGTYEVITTAGKLTASHIQPSSAILLTLHNKTAQRPLFPSHAIGATPAGAQDGSHYSVFSTIRLDRQLFGLSVELL